MARKAPPREFKRARSTGQKEQRRREILAAARAQLAEVGVTHFSMVPLAKAAGVARATLYLYFRTREELLLTLYLEQVEDWLEEVERVTGPGMPVDDFLRAIFESAVRRDTFLMLAAQVTGVIESNVSVESLAESKRHAATLVEVAGRRTSLALGRPAAQGPGIATGLFALLLGVTQAFRAPDIDVTTLPAEIRPLLEGEAPIDAFLRVGRWLVEGSR
jgi:AcrR family transcriptional regulator